MLAIVLPTTSTTAAIVQEILRTDNFDATGNPRSLVRAYFDDPTTYIDKREVRTIEVSLPVGRRFTEMATSIFELSDQPASAIANGMLLDHYKQDVHPLSQAPAQYMVSTQAYQKAMQRNTDLQDYLVQVILAAPIPILPYVHTPIPRRCPLRVILPPNARQKLDAIAAMMICSNGSTDAIALDYVLTEQPNV